MAETKWTPGPWQVSDMSDATRFSVRSTAEKQWPETDNDTGKAITGWGCVQQTEANAHLIAAAPTLYDILDRLYIDRRDDGYHDDFQEEIANALAEARGEA